MHVVKRFGGDFLRILTTGNLGYLGSPIVRALRAAGHHVIGLDTGWFVPQAAELPDWPHVQVFADLRDVQVPLAVDAVVHLAGLSNDPLCELSETLTMDINARGTIRLIERYPRARHVIVSSCSVYGAADMATEETEPHPLTAYARAKLAVDRFARRFDAVSLRLGTVYGYSPQYRLDLVLNKMCHDMAVDGRAFAFGNARRPLVHVDDVAGAVLLALGHGNGVYNVAPENWRMAELAEEVAGQGNGLAVLSKGDADARDYAASCIKLLNLGWKPMHTVRETIPGLLALRLPEREYRRLPALRELMRSHLTADLRAQCPRECSEHCSEECSEHCDGQCSTPCKENA